MLHHERNNHTHTHPHTRRHTRAHKHTGLLHSRPFHAVYCQLIFTAPLFAGGLPMSMSSCLSNDEAKNSTAQHGTVCMGMEQHSSELRVPCRCRPGHSITHSTCQVTRAVEVKERVRSSSIWIQGTTRSQEPNSNNSSADRCYSSSRQKISGYAHLSVAERSIAGRHDIDVGTLAVGAHAASDKIEDVHGSRQSCETCNGANELAAQTLLCDENCVCNLLYEFLLIKNGWNAELHCNAALRGVFVVCIFTP